jgi:hypothetical protein
MGNSVNIGREQLLDLIESVILENKTFLKVGNNGGEQTPPPMAPPVEDVLPVEQPMPQQDMGDMGDGGLEDPTAGEENQFDTNFDAGVEADEDSDPKTYIQQLTGKLSQSLNSFNDEQGADAGLNKYVASMIAVAACKYLDEKDKKEIIDKINSAQSDTEESMPDNGEFENSDMGDGADLQEAVYSKKQIMEMVSGVGIRPGNEIESDVPVKQEEPVNTIFRGKTFSK